MSSTSLNKTTQAPESGLTRIDRSIAEKVLDFRQYKEDEDLCRNIVIYLFQSFQEDIFGFAEIDPYKFAEKMGYKSRSDLFERIPEPYQFNGPVKLAKAKIESLRESKEAFETKFENALYKLHSIPFQFRKRTEKPNGEIEMTSTSDILIRELRMVINPLEKKNPKAKKKYSWKPNSYFLENYSLYFLKAHIETYNSLRLSYLQPLYLQMLHLREIFKMGEEVSPTFENLCELCNAKASRPSDRKVKINKEFKKLNSTNQIFEVKIEWTNNGRFDYKPKLIFKDKMIISSDPKEERVNLLKQFYLLDAFENFKNIQSSGEVEDFKKWLNAPEKNYDLKQKSFLKAHEMAFGKVIDPAHKRVRHYIETGKLI